ncbi:MAG: response regulator transcription factor [Ignavibacteriaceae bacterium]
MENEKKISIIIADDHGLFRSGIKEILNSFGDVALIGEAENGAQLVELYKNQKADVILVDISMPEMSGIEALIEIRKFDMAVKALFLSMYDAEEYVYAVLMSGGLGLVNKNTDKEELYDAIKAVRSGERYFKNLSSEQLEQIIKKFESKDFLVNNYKDLTKREKKILYYISEGLTSSEIAKKVKLGKRTVDTHRTHLIKKLNLRSLPDLIKFAIQYTILSKESIDKEGSSE